MDLEEKTTKQVGASKELGDEKVQDIRIHGNLGSEDLSKYGDKPSKSQKSLSGIAGTVNITTNIVFITPSIDEKGILKELASSMRKNPGMDVIRRLFGE